MDTLDFLGGKYQGGEQILPGVIQTYRALESATGRSVFVHRVASSDDPNEQVVLYRLLSAALVRSPAVRSMILDMREDTRDWLVVTETDPRCLLLREWLQFELDNSAKAPDSDKAHPSEKKSAPLIVTGGFSPEPTPAKAGSEPGEFTRFFQTGSGAAPPPRANMTERTSRTVQRPNTPMPVVPPAPAPAAKEEGEFTRIFSRSAVDKTPGPMPLPGARQSPNDFENLFTPKEEFGMPGPVPARVAGEFTRTFGNSNAPPQVQPPAALGQRSRTDLDDPLALIEPSSAVGPPAAMQSNTLPNSTMTGAGPSEYTRIISGGNRPETNAPVATAGGAPAALAPVSLPGVATPALPHVAPPALPHASAPALPQVSAPAAPHVPAVPIPPAPAIKAPALPPVAPAPPSAAASAAAPNRKLIIFLSALGVLALLLILLVLFALRK